MHGVHEPYARPESASRGRHSRPDEHDDKPNQWPRHRELPKPSGASADPTTTSAKKERSQQRWIRRKASDR